MGDDFRDGTDENGEEQGFHAKMEGSADDEADDAADFRRRIAEGGHEELLVTVQHDIGCRAEGEEEERGGDDREADAEAVVNLVAVKILFVFDEGFGCFRRAWKVSS